MLSLRVELKTSRLLNGCSNQLSYESSSCSKLLLILLSQNEMVIWFGHFLTKHLVNSRSPAHFLEYVLDSPNKKGLGSFFPKLQFTFWGHFVFLPLKVSKFNHNLERYITCGFKSFRPFNDVVIKYHISLSCMLIDLIKVCYVNLIFPCQLISRSEINFEKN